MLALYLLLYTVAAVLFILAALGHSANVGNRQFNLLGLGLFFWTLVPLLMTVQKL